MSSTKKRRRHKRRKIFTKEYDDEDDELYDSSVNGELRMLGFQVDDDDDDDRGSQWGYDLKEKIMSDRYEKDAESMVERLEGKDFNERYFHEYGFKRPIHFDRVDDLGILMPSSSDFNVVDVKSLVGANRMIDVVDVKTQRGFQMTLKEFVDYYQRPRRDRLLNVLSLEFSKTKLAEYVGAPAAVKNLDWVELAWPQELRDQQQDATNALNSMKYPKVQNYCLMSVADCYTDFHVDFGGTSVWYHILRGEKIFWLVPPTEENCRHFQSWTLSGRQHKTFFGDMVERCVRVKLKAGDTFMIPSGWFHAVYTPVDSLVFGGNFLHSFAIPMQLSVYEIERNTHVPPKFRYPFFLEMQWFVLERYYYILTGQHFLQGHETLTSDSSAPTDQSPNTIDQSTNASDQSTVQLRDQALLLTDFEAEGLHVLVNWLQSLPGSKRRTPDLIERPEVLLERFQSLLPFLESTRRQPSPHCYTLLSLGMRQFQVEPNRASIVQGSQKCTIKKKDDHQTLDQCNNDFPILSASTSMNESSFELSTTPTSSAPKAEVEAAKAQAPVEARKLEVLQPEEKPLSSMLDIAEEKALNGNLLWESLPIVPPDLVPVIGAECTIGP